MRRPAAVPVVLWVSFCLFILLPEARAADAPAGTSASESARLHQLFDLNWESRLEGTPEFATYIGFPGHNDRWSDESPAGIEHRHEVLREQLKTAQSIDRGR